ncbi:MAG: hypothetical protein ABI596_13655 [Pyrinomonadaceae bacterium]
MFRNSIRLPLLIAVILVGAASQRPLRAAQDKPVTAEQVVESVIAAYGTRAGLAQIRRNGLERGEITRIAADGRTEKADYSWRFIRGENSEKDKFRLDHKSPTLEYALVYSGGRTWGIINGATFAPRQDATDDFLTQERHGLDALLRYKENGSTIAYVGKEKQKGLNLYVVDVTDKDKRRTRYYVSARTLRVLWLEYEETAPGSTTPVKFMRKFSDYNYAQGTLVPKRTVTFEGDKQVQEKKVKTVTYGVKMEDSLFQNPEAQTSSTTP